MNKIWLKKKFGTDSVSEIQTVFELFSYKQKKEQEGKTIKKKEEKPKRLCETHYVTILF